MNSSIFSDYVVAGPCSAENLEQVLKCAEFLKKHPQVKLMRAGIWKPRTSPQSFEGLGEKALPWLKSIQDEVKLPVIIEVAQPAHVEMALKFEIKHFWIGARTTANPFSMQELAQSLQGNSEVQVWVKNPIHPDVGLWIGAIERLQNVGLKNLGAIHRGFNVFEKSEYKNAPLWHLSTKLRHTFPTLPILLDPSHMAGKRPLIPDLCQQGLDRDYSGLMLEVHPDPTNALSDPEQQLSFEDFTQTLQKLNWKKSDPSHDYERKITLLRDHIDHLDHELIHQLKQRFDVVEELHLLKKESAITPFQKQRFLEMLTDRLIYAQKFNLDQNFIQNIFSLIHEEALRLQTDDIAKT